MEMTGFEPQVKQPLCQLCRSQCDQKKIPNVYKSCPPPKFFFFIDFDTFTKIA